MNLTNIIQEIKDILPSNHKFYEESTVEGIETIIVPYFSTFYTTPKQGILSLLYGEGCYYIDFFFSTEIKGKPYYIEFTSIGVNCERLYREKFYSSDSGTLKFLIETLIVNTDKPFNTKLCE